MNIIPAILPHSFEEIQEKCSRVNGLVNKIQIDICDGFFGRERTWMPSGGEILPEGFAFEFDIMLNDWKISVEKCLNFNPFSIVAHVDTFSDDDISYLVNLISPHSIKLGISVSNDKSLDFHIDMIRRFRLLYSNIFIQVMGIQKIGEQAQMFDEESLNRIKYLKQNFGDILVQVDGGMNPTTVLRVSDVGAESVVVGSYIFGREDAGASLSEINSAVN